MGLKIVVWLFACSFSLSADAYLASEKQSNGRRNEAGSRDKEVPEFMANLYQSIEAGNKQLPVGNTVRTMAGKLMRLSDGSLLVVYNISALATAASNDERILRADIRCSRQPSASSYHGDNKTATSAILLEMTSRRFRQLGKHLLSTSRDDGRASADVTSSLRRLRRRRRRLPSLRRRSSVLALTFASSGGPRGGDGRGPSAERRRRTAAELGLSSSPMLVVFSRRTADIAVDHVLPRVRQYDPSASPRRHRHEQKTRRSKRLVDGQYGGNVVDWYPGIDNSLPLDHGNSTGVPAYNVPPVLTDTAHLKRQRLSHHRQNVATTSVSGMANSPVSRGDHNNLTSHRSVETQPRKTKKLPEQPSTFLNFSEAAESDIRRRSLACSRRRLAVDAVDIGWDEHVIFPRRFQADYCAGSCPFPRSTVAKLTNHATIRSLIHAIGIVGDVPSPCCVADQMWSLPVLYVDYDDSVVLTVYQDAVVSSCVCR